MQRPTCDKGVPEYLVCESSHCTMCSKRERECRDWLYDQIYDGADAQRDVSICPACGRQFVPSAKRPKLEGAMYCSLDCAVEGMGPLEIDPMDICDLQMQNPALNHAAIDEECPSNNLCADGETCAIHGQRCIGIECEAHQKPVGDSKRLAYEHWDYVHGVITRTDPELPGFLVDMLKFHYISSFIHGFKHGAENQSQAT